MKKKKLIIFGLKHYAQIMYEYFSQGDEFEVVGFCSYKEFITQEKLLNLPVYDFEYVTKNFSPQEYYFFVAIGYENLNETRQKIYHEFKKLNYKAASYISKNAFVWQNAKLGEHIFIAEGSVLQPFVEIGNNIVIWPNCTIGHHSKLKDHSFIAAGTNFGGCCEFGENSFCGIGAIISEYVKVENGCFISHGAKIDKNLNAFSLADKNSVIKEMTEESLKKTLAITKMLKKF